MTTRLRLTLGRHRNVLGPRTAGLPIVVDAVLPPETLAMQEEFGLRHHRPRLRPDAQACKTMMSLPSMTNLRRMMYQVAPAQL